MLRISVIFVISCLITLPATAANRKSHPRKLHPPQVLRGPPGDERVFGSLMPDLLSRQGFFAAFLAGEKMLIQEVATVRSGNAWREPAFDIDELMRHYERSYFQARYRHEIK